MALAVLGCDLKLLGCDWLTAVVTLQKLAGVRGGELSVCYEAVAPFYNIVATRHPLYIGSEPPTPCPNGGKAVTGAQEEGCPASGLVEGQSPEDNVDEPPPGDGNTEKGANAAGETAPPPSDTVV